MKDQKKFNRAPLGHREVFDLLWAWQKTERLQCGEGGVWSGRYSVRQIVRGNLLLRYWWVRGLELQAFRLGKAAGYLTGFNDGRDYQCQKPDEATQ